MTNFTTKGITRTSGWVQSALPMGEVRALPGGAGHSWQFVNLAKFRSESFML